MLFVIPVIHKLSFSTNKLVIFLISWDVVYTTKMCYTVGVSLIITKSIIQHKFYSDIRIEITHNILIFSPALYHYLSLTWIAAYCCETNIFWLILDGKPACIEIFVCSCLNASSSARSCACPRHGTTIRCTLVQKWAHNAFNHYAIRCSFPKQVPKWWLVLCIDLFRISIKIIPDIESTKLRYQWYPYYTG